MNLIGGPNYLEDRNSWRGLKNKVNKMVRKEGKNFNPNELLKLEGDRSAKSIWNYVKGKRVG